MKRNACVLGQRNFVEIDLLRAGQRMPLGSDYPPAAYAVVVFRLTRPGKCGVWPIGLRDVMPVIPVPLAEGENELSVDMSPMVNDIYVTSRYEASINYDLALIPPLGDEDARWVDQLLRESGRHRAQGRPDPCGLCRSSHGICLAGSCPYHFATGRVAS